MNVGFAGTPAFAATVLAALCDAGFAPRLVLTQPDRPRGRGLRLAGSPVKALALARSLAVDQPPTLRDPAAQQRVAAAGLDVLVVAAYGLLLPAAVLAAPRHGCINVHASILPRWRGAAPIQRAILAGDAETGATLMQMDAGLDTGPTLDCVRVPIGPRDTTGSLERRVADVGAAALVGLLRRLASGTSLSAMPQPATGHTYAAKIGKEEAAIDWRTAAAAIDRQVRALDPAPGAHTELAGVQVKVWRARQVACDGGAAPGNVVVADARGIVVACGEGCLALEEVQPAGRRRMGAEAFAAGRLSPNARFGAPTCGKPSA